MLISELTFSLLSQNAHKVPPPWLIAMQRYGPPPSYPNLKIPGLNSPIPEVRAQWTCPAVQALTDYIIVLMLMQINMFFLFVCFFSCFLNLCTSSSFCSSACQNCTFGYHAGGWGKPPVDEMGKPLYGDVFGTNAADFQVTRKQTHTKNFRVLKGSVCKAIPIPGKVLENYTSSNFFPSFSC